MERESLIRRVCDSAFVALLAGGVATGGGAALAGLPKFLDAALPGMAAMAAPDPGVQVARFSLPDGFAQSRYAPQVLYPVIGNPFPDWLKSPAASLPRRVAEAPAIAPVMAIVIDDLGADLAGTDRAMMLPKEVALSFLPYPETTPFLAEAAARRGHMILAHVPMQAFSGTHAPMALRPDMTPDEITRRLDWNLSRVPGIVGMNNHEGSRFTTDAPALTPVMARLKAKGLFFFDSRTSPRSAAERVAADMGVMSAGRDIFLDDVPGEEEVIRQLQALVREAKRTGVAIAIGHPRDATLTHLKKFLSEDHGVKLVPLDEAMRLKTARGLRLIAR